MGKKHERSDLVYKAATTIRKVQEQEKESHQAIVNASQRFQNLHQYKTSHSQSPMAHIAHKLCATNTGCSFVLNHARPQPAYVHDCVIKGEGKKNGLFGM